MTGMMQDLSNSLYQVGAGLESLLKDNQEALGISQVYYGEQQLYPEVPAVAIEPIMLDRILAGTGIGGSTENSFTVYIYIYHGTLEEVQKSRKQCDKLAADIERVLHHNLQLNGIIVHGFVTKCENGQANRGQLLGATRLTWEGLSKTLLGA